MLASLDRAIAGVRLVEVAPLFAALRARMDPGRYNGASLLGLRGIVIKSHGSADAYAFGQALARAVEEVCNSVPQRIAAQMAQVEETVPS